MPVSSPEVDRAYSKAPSVRAMVAALLVLFGALSLVPSTAGAATPKILKKTKIVAPTTANYVRGTLTGTKCYVKFPAVNRKVTVTVTGPLTAKKPKSKKLTVKRVKPKGSTSTKNARKAYCTWKTKSFADGTYRLTAKGQIKVKKKWYSVALKRAVNVRNTVSAAAVGQGPRMGVGNARYVSRLETEWDSWLTQADADPARQAWINDHMWQLVVHTPFFDHMTKWSPQALVYKDLYAVYRGDTKTLAEHPEWVLKDANGQNTTIPWGCDPGPCPQFAGDFGNPAFRAEWINQARVTLAQGGYKGIWIDDANMEMRISDQTGKQIAPIDPRTGQPMTFLNFRKYMSEFLVEIRRALPQAELVANVLWFGGSAIGRDADPYIIKAYTAMNRLNLERGFNDDGLTGGSAPRDIWSVDAFMQFIDRMHDRGIPVTLDSAVYGKDAWEYNLAGFFLVDRGADAVGEKRLTPGDWWNGWDVSIGKALGDRTRGSDGVFRRAFEKGLVFLNPPRGQAKTITLPRPMKRIDGSTVTKITVPSGRGAVLIG